jgi:anti-sigma B factor antagonist
MSANSDRPLTVDVSQAPGGALVRLVGSAGMDQAHRLQERLEELVARRDPLIVLDLSGLEFVCSMGLGAIIAAYLRARRHDAEMRLAAPRPAVRQLLETTRLTKLLGVFDTVEDAFHSFRHPA